MRKLRSKKGFTLAETLIVTAIILILAALAFIAVINYLRSMTKLEYDGYSQSLFVAAQNHLTMAAHEGYLGRTDFGTEEPEIEGVEGSGSGVYYFVVKNGSGLDDPNSILGLMLPYGAIDENARKGNYIIRYHKDSAQVLDVFYWEDSGRYPHNYSDEYADFLKNRGNREALKKYTDRSVIGYYGGVEAQGLKDKAEKLLAPSIEVQNGDLLSVKVTDPNGGASIRLIIIGVTSGKRREIELTAQTADNQYTYILDNITGAGGHFYDKLGQGGSDENNLIPGENITLQAVAYRADTPSVAYSPKRMTNSLFATGSDANTAKISSLRHLENLYSAISRLGANDGANQLNITKAEQTTDLRWNDFCIGAGNNTIYRIDGSDGGEDCFIPVNPADGLDYDGGGYSISGLNVNTTGPAGLFGTFADGSIENLKLEDLSVRGGAGAGALAGELDTVTVTNVLAVHSKGQDARSVSSSSGSAGGLVGTMIGGELINSAAALRVSGATAGGLIGTMTGGSVSGCDSGGHTTGGAYDPLSFNVTATGASGGLIGEMTGGSVENSYSTCSAAGATAGGFVGTATGTIENSYCTGIVGGTKAGAFAGELSQAPDGCSYFGLINDAGLPAVPDGTFTDAQLSAFDKNTSSYKEFTVGGVARPYDSALLNKYNLRTVAQLGAEVGDGFVSVHYGDWPAPEIFFVNVPNP